MNKDKTRVKTGTGQILGMKTVQANKNETVGRVTKKANSKDPTK